MGAIVSHRKQPRKARVEHKAIAVNAFKATEQSKPKSEDSSEQPITDQNSNKHLNENSTNVAVSSWGEGVVGTSTHSLQEKGVVTSRGMNYDVTTSRQLYPQINDKPKTDHSYVIVTSLQPGTAATTIQRHVRGHQARKDLEEKQKAAAIIQKHVRGHQARLELKQQEQAAKLIQQKYRKHLNDPDRQPQQQNGEVSSGDEDDGSDDPDKEQYRKAWKESTPQATVLDKNMKIGDKTKESFHNYQDDITNLKWKTEQQLELTTMGDDYVPPRILLIASNVSRSDILEKIVKDDVILIYYEFTTATMESLIEEISTQLENYKTNSKARSIGFVCKGGPGFINPVQSKMITKKKVKQDDDLTSFWKTLGTKMSKLDYQDTKIHIIGCNVAGNKQGKKLLKFLSKFMKPSIVKVESPLEISPAGKEMLSLYFNYDKYRTWRTRMHSKVSFDI